MTRHIALYGGSFDPIHWAHVSVVTQVQAMCRVDEIWVLPVYKHPFGKQLASFDTRMDLCKRSFENHRDVYVHDFEKYNESGLTLDLVRDLKKDFTRYEFSLVLGADLTLTLDLWDGFYEHTCKLAHPIFVSRGGVWSTNVSKEFKALEATHLTYPGPEISSTDIRERIRRGESVSHMVPWRALTEIDRLQLYR